MSAPSAGSPNGSPVPGYYPDPSIPGYIRYWNGSAWTPGTSRPAPGPGEPPPAPPAEATGAGHTGEAPSPEPDDEEDEPDEIDLGRVESAPKSLPDVPRRGELTASDSGTPTDWGDPRRLPGGAPSWQPGADQAPDLSWGAPHRAGQDQGMAWGASRQEAPTPPAAPDPAPATDPRSGWEPAAGNDAAPGGQAPPPDHTMAMRTPLPDPEGGTPGFPGQNPGPDHTVAMRMQRPDAADGDRNPAGFPEQQAGPQPDYTVGLRRSDVLAQQDAAVPPPSPQQAPSYGHHATGYAQPPHDPYAGQGHGGPLPDGGPGMPETGHRPSWAQQQHVPHQPGPAQAPHQPGPAQAPHQPGPAQAPPNTPTPFPGGGQGGTDSAAPWRPPVSSPFADAAREARPASLGKRLVARTVDGLLTAVVTGAVAYPFVGKWTAHIQQEIEATRQAGVTRQIWLVDGTTGVYLAAVLGAFLLFGLLYEVLPTAKWGRTPGKKLLGVTVLDVERQDVPGFGQALRRWLTHSVLNLLVLGILDALWCLFDRPWRQCWHDKTARTFVAGDR
ncbi:RDD family protein [Streptomyces sp. TR06-5]|uniref:RDD family protein n=1 Tax=Streptomyces sp. TR06-5 TaxID=3385976 RepID=UPI00399F5650